MNLKLFLATTILCGSWGVPSTQAEDLGKEIVVTQTGGFFRTMLQKYMYEPFAKASGVAVVPVDIEIPDQWAKVEAMVRKGKIDYDMVTSTGGDLIEKKALFYKIDCSALPNVVKNGLPGSCTPYGVVRQIGVQMMSYDTSVFGDKGPKTWPEFWDVKKFPGARAMPDTGDRDWWLPAIALMADGVKPSELWPMDLDRAYKKLDEIRPHVAVWWKTGDQMQQVMRNKEAVAVIGYSGRALAVVREKLPWTMVWDNTLRDAGFMSIMKDASNLKGALAYIDFFYANSQGSADFMREVNYATPSKDGLQKLPPAEQSLYPTAPENFSRMIVPDFEWIGKNRTMLRQRWNSWISR